MDAHPGSPPLNRRSSLQVENNEIVFPMELSNTIGTSLDQLNDDCLFEIFSSNCFTPLDLCSLAETCTRFKRLAQGAFPRDFKIVIGPECFYKREYKFQSKNYSGIHTSVDVVRILTNFGCNLSALTMHGNDPIVTNLVAKYCDGGTLKRIEIFAIGIIEDLRVKFKKIFQKLLAFSINGVHTDHRLGGTTIQLNCDSLLELEIVYVDYCSAILQNTFPKLERFSFKQSVYDERDTLLDFIGRHKCLRILEWYTGFSIRFHNDFANAIGNGCKELEELTLRNCRNNNILDLSKLHSLSKLRMLDVEILDENNQLAGLLSSLKSLETLKLSNMLVEADVVGALAQLQHLRELHLVGCCFDSILWPMLPLTKLRLINHTFTTSELLDIISQLINLEELEIYFLEGNFVKGEKLYAKIEKIINRRPNEVTLKCRFKFGSSFWNEYQKIKLIN